MKLITPQDFSRALFRDGALDLALAAGLLAAGGITSLGWHEPWPLLAALAFARLLYYGLRRWIFIPRAGYARIKDWRATAPLFMVAFLLVLGSWLLTWVYRGPIPPHSPVNLFTEKTVLGELAIALFTGSVCLGLRRLGLYGLAVLVALLVPGKVMPPTVSFAVLALPPLSMGLWLMMHFFQEPRHADA